MLYVSVYQVRVGVFLDGMIVISPVRTHICTYVFYLLFVQYKYIYKYMYILCLLFIQ